jgi:hypothetical protein
MRSLITLAAFGGLAYGIWDFSKYMKKRRIDRLQGRRLEIWEGEGGAVPVAATRTAAQVRPKKTSSTSSRGVS